MILGFNSDGKKLSNLDGLYEIKVPEPVGEPVALWDRLSDNSVVCYDRGSTYGEYLMVNGDVVKQDSGSDWRYMICEKYDLNHYETDLGTGGTDQSYSGKQWGDSSQNDSGANGTAIGTGKDNTDYLIGRYSSDTYLWYYVNQHRTNTGKDWCVPSKDELNILYENLTQIGNFSTNTNPWYWSSSQYSSNNACDQTFSSGGQGNYVKFYTLYRVRCVRFI